MLFLLISFYFSLQSYLLGNKINVQWPLFSQMKVWNWFQAHTVIPVREVENVVIRLIKFLNFKTFPFFPAFLFFHDCHKNQIGKGAAQRWNPIE